MKKPNVGQSQYDPGNDNHAANVCHVCKMAKRGEWINPKSKPAIAPVTDMTIQAC
jgi:hypothetical protein